MTIAEVKPWSFVNQTIWNPIMIKVRISNVSGFQNVGIKILTVFRLWNVEIFLFFERAVSKGNVIPRLFANNYVSLKIRVSSHLLFKEENFLKIRKYFWYCFSIWKEKELALQIYSRFSRSFTARGVSSRNPPGYKANKLYFRSNHTICLSFKCKR